MGGIPGKPVRRVGDVAPKTDFEASPYLATMNSTQVAITGIGIHSALGQGLEANTAALQAGKSGIVAAPERWQEFGLRSLVCGQIDIAGLAERFDRRQNRFMCEPALLAAAAMQDAIHDAGLEEAEVQSLFAKRRTQIETTLAEMI